MTLDPTAEVTVGGALLLVIFMLLKFKPWERKNNNHIRPAPTMIATQPPRAATAGEQDTAYWEKRYDAIDSKLEEISRTLDRMERKQ